MNLEGSFSRLVRLIQEGVDDELGLHRQLIELLYEMSRIQQVSWEPLSRYCKGPFSIICCKSLTTANLFIHRYS